jgi:hypothetical protein
VYESISAGQRFRGEIQGSESDLAILRSLAPSGWSPRLGRSRSAQYGGRSLWSWRAIGNPANHFHANGVHSSGGGTQTVMVRLLSPLIALNECGHPVAEFPKEEFHPAARELRAFTRREFAGGYLSHQNLPRQQMPALAPGSTIVLEVPADCDLQAAVRRSYGLRTEDGFGRIAIYAVQVKGSSGIWDEEEQGRYSAGPVADPLLAKLFLRKAEEQALRDAYSKAASARNLPALRAHFAYRLIQALEQPGGEGLAALVAEMKKAGRTGAKQLDGVRQDKETLREYLTNTAKAPDANLRSMLESLNAPTGPRGLLESDALAGGALTRAYLIHYLGRLAQLSQGKGDPK